MVPGAKPTQASRDSGSNQRTECWSDSPDTSRLGGGGCELPYGCMAWWKKQGILLGSRQAVLTFDVPGQVQVDPGKAPLSFQGDFFWLQVTRLDLESPAEDSRHSWQVIDFEHLLLARSNVALQGVGEERRNVPKRVWWKDGSDDRDAEMR